jgi:hypothetical protein
MKLRIELNGKRGAIIYTQATATLIGKGNTKRWIYHSFAYPILLKIKGCECPSGAGLDAEVTEITEARTLSCTLFTSAIKILARDKASLFEIHYRGTGIQQSIIEAGNTDHIGRTH